MGDYIFTSRTIKRRRRSNHCKRALVENSEEFCRNTTLHGLRYIVNEKLYRRERLYFIISVLVAIIFSGYFIMKVYDKWATTPVIVGINPNPTLISKEPFPAVTICNLNQALKTKALSLAPNSTEFAIVQLLCKQAVRAKLVESITDWSVLEQIIIDISQECRDMILSCSFGAQEYNCSDIFYPIVTDEGLCCVFNMLHPKFMYLSYIPLPWKDSNTSHAVPINWYAEQGYPDKLPPKYFPFSAAGVGESLGLTLILDVQYNEYYCSSANSYGFKVAMHSPNETPNVRETGVLIATGRESKVRIRPEKMESKAKLQSMKLKYRRCLFHDEGRLRYFRHYTQRNCEMECMSDMIMKYCGCITYSMPKIFENATVCSIQQMRCVEIVRLRIDPHIESCLDGCWPSCYDLTFYMDVFSAPLKVDGINIANPKLGNFSKSYMKKNIAVVNMYFKEHNFRSSIQNEFIGFTDFLSSVGGLMGLFIGFSFISIVELFYYGIILPLRKFIDRNKYPNTAEMEAAANASRFKRKPLNRRCLQRSNRINVRPPIPKYGTYDSTYINLEMLKGISKSRTSTEEQ